MKLMGSQQLAHKVLAANIYSTTPRLDTTRPVSWWPIAIVLAIAIGFGWAFGAVI